MVYQLRKGTKNGLVEERDKTNRTFYIWKDQLERLENEGNPSERVRTILDTYFNEEIRKKAALEFLEAMLEEMDETSGRLVRRKILEMESEIVLDNAKGEQE